MASPTHIGAVIFDPPAGLSGTPTTHAQDDDQIVMLIQTDEVNIQDQLFNGSGWVTSPISTAVGIPLKMRQLNANTPATAPYSRYINNLLVDVDPNSDEFGTYTLPPLRSRILLAREDSEELTSELLLPLLSLMRSKVVPLIRRYAESTSETTQRMIKALVPYYTSPMAYAKVWDLTRTTNMHGPNDRWMNAVCPVSPNTTRRCEKCGTQESDENRLRACADCKVVYYCHRECQHADWRNRHKLAYRELRRRVY